jgi:hypothetical protein
MIAYVRSMSDSTIVAQIPLLMNPGTVEVRVTVRGAANRATINLDVQLGTPVIAFFSPSMAVDPGVTIEINGRNFGSQKDQLAVTFDSLPASVSSVANTRIVVMVPAPTRRGDVLVVVTVGGRSSAPATFKILPIGNPSISAVAPDVARQGSAIAVFGSHFGSNPTLLHVQFCRDPYNYYGLGGSLDCRTASFSGLSDTHLTVRVPPDLTRHRRWDLLITRTGAPLPATASVWIL